MSLAALLEHGTSFVVRANGTAMTHADLSRRSDDMRNYLRHVGVQPGDRVGIRMHKSPESLVAIFGILKAGAIYVPVDADSPASRAATILQDCGVRAVVSEAGLQAELQRELQALDAVSALVDPAALPDAPPVQTHASRPEDIAYILYTSGSTGRPKGVVLTHGNALSFLEWCSRTFNPRADDVFSSHAPFHFDLSILDIYLPLMHGATLVLIDEELGKEPLRLARAIADEGITHWYSTPSVLNLLRVYGKLERGDYSALRTVLFAGEVFPIPSFLALTKVWPHPRYYNLYGPTETNVCTWYEVPAGNSWSNHDTFPIGRICSPNQARVVNDSDVDVVRGEEGELVVYGPNVMQGYWNLPQLNARAFLVDANGRRWYRTGDLVTEDDSGVYTYRGRRDRMVKRRGYRVELGEIEAALMRHPDVQETAVIAGPDPAGGLRIVAFVVVRPGRSLGIIGLKSHSARSLPPYMVPDSFSILEALPRTSTHKIDLQALKSRLPGTEGAA